MASEVVREQRQRNDERHLAGRVRLDERQQLGAIAWFERVLEVAEQCRSTLPCRRGVATVRSAFMNSVEYRVCSSARGSDLPPATSRPRR